MHNASYSDDSTYAGTYIALWKVLEVSFGVICGCLPAVKPFVKPLLPKSFLSSNKRSRATEQSDLYGKDSFNRLGNEGVSHLYGDVDLRHIKHPSSDRIMVSTVTSVIGQSKRSSDSEEIILQREGGRYTDRR